MSGLETFCFFSYLYLYLNNKNHIYSAITKIFRVTSFLHFFRCLPPSLKPFFPRDPPPPPSDPIELSYPVRKRTVPNRIVTHGNELKNKNTYYTKH